MSTTTQQAGAYYRFFVARGAKNPLVAAVTKVVNERRKAYGKLRAFTKDVGASEMYGTSPASYVFDFPSDKDVDKAIWRETKPVRGTYYFTPRKNTPEGKAMIERIKALPACPNINSAIAAALPDVHADFPIIVEGNRWMSPHIRYYSMREPAQVLIQIPWRDESQKRLDAYRKQLAKPEGKRTEWDHTLDYLLQELPSWLKEIKEWEALKLLDDTRAGES